MTNNASADQQAGSVDDLLKLSLEDLSNITITSASYFPETSRDVASTATVMSRQNWEKCRSRRLNDALLSMPSVVALPNFLGQSSVRIRGYALSDARGIATSWYGG